MTAASLRLVHGSLQLSEGVLHARASGEEHSTAVGSILEITVLRHPTTARLTVQPEGGFLQTYDVADVGPRLDQFVSSLREAHPRLDVYVGSDDEISLDFASGRLTLTADSLMVQNDDQSGEALQADEIVQSIVWDFLGETMGLVLVLRGGEVTRGFHEWPDASSQFIRRYPDCRPVSTLRRFVTALKAKNPPMLIGAAAVRMQRGRRPPSRPSSAGETW